MDGSGRITLRNRAFLKRIVPFQGRIKEPGQPGGVTLNRRTGPGGLRASKEVEQPGEGVPEEPKIAEEEVAVRLPALEPEGPRRSSRNVSRPARYPE